MSLFVLVSAAQQPQRGATPTAASPQTQTPPPIRVTTQLIVEEVAVKDKSGKPVEGLTPNDFVLTEDGMPQTISFVEFQRLQSAGHRCHSVAVRTDHSHCAAGDNSADCAGTTGRTALS